MWTRRCKIGAGCVGVQPGLLEQARGEQVPVQSEPCSLRSWYSSKITVGWFHNGEAAEGRRN